MKLFIIRDQAKGLLGGVKFDLRVKVELTRAEAELVKRYKAEKEVLVQKKIDIPLTGRALKLNLTIQSLTSGESFKCADISEILEMEENVKQACELFKSYLEVMNSFGGEEIIEYT